jgi:hypothetical protein
MTTNPNVTRLASILVDLEYAPGVLVRDEDNLADFAARLIAAGVGFPAEARQQERDRIAAEFNVFFAFVCGVLIGQDRLTDIVRGEWKRRRAAIEGESDPIVKRHVNARAALRAELEKER